MVSGNSVKTSIKDILLLEAWERVLLVDLVVTVEPNLISLAYAARDEGDSQWEDGTKPVEMPLRVVGFDDLDEFVPDELSYEVS